MVTNLKLIIALLASMSFQFLAAQNTEIDSVKLILQKHTAKDTQRVLLLNDLAYKHYKIDLDKTFNYADQAFQIADSLNYLRGKAESLKIKGIYYDIRSEYSKAIEFYQQALNIFERLKDNEGISASYHNIGVVFKLMGDYNQALIYYQKSLEIEKKIGDQRGIAISYYTIANLHIKENNYEKGLDYYQKALNLFKELGNKSEIATCLNNMGILYYDQEEMAKATELFNQSLSISIEIGEKFIEVPNYISLGLVYLNEKNYKRAYLSGKKASKIANEIGAVKLIMESSELLAKSCKQLGKYEEAYNYHETFKLMSDSLLNEDRIRKVTVLEYQYRFEKEKHTIQLEQQKRDAINMEKTKREIILRNAFLIGFIMLLILIGIILYALNQKRKANKILLEQKSEIQVKSKKLDNLNNEIKELAESLNELNATKDKFFSIIAHDLKSPFSSVFGLSESLLEDHESMKSDERKRFIKRLYDSSKQIYKLLENLLTWAQIQRGALNLKFEPFKICDLINGVGILLDETIKSKEITISIHCGIECNIIADKNMIETVIRNIISNALKFTHRGGKIDISVIKQDNYFKVSIQDNGIGIDNELKDNLFSITESKSRLGTENEIGSGLGLILCKEFIDKHKGEIWAEDAPDKGSIFHFTIPLQ